jgi:hypothetical protein
MNKRIARLLSAAAALTAFSAANAAVPSQASELAPPTTYRDLLNPIPNAAAAVKADDARIATDATSGHLQLVQYYYHHHHHHHHHHHFVPPPFRPFFRHHHHHHVYIVR